jgi:hypothetical protein
MQAIAQKGERTPLPGLRRPKSMACSLAEYDSFLQTNDNFTADHIIKPKAN